MGALTPPHSFSGALPRRRHWENAEVSLLHVPRLPTILPPTTAQPPAIAFLVLLAPALKGHPASAGAGSHSFKPSAWPVNSRLRPLPAGSPGCRAESSSSTCGLVVCLALLSTPPRGDAVTFDLWS